MMPRPLWRIRMRARRRGLVNVFAAGLVVCVCVAANGAEVAARADIERWADGAMPVKGGLVAWLDATRQPAAFEAAGRGQVAPNGELDVCYDASGNPRHFAQPVRGSQPKYVAGE